MECVFCGSLKTKVIDKRTTDNNKANRRRRECKKCNKRFTTYERIEGTNINVIKKDGSLEAFMPEKIKNGVLKAFEKRDISKKEIEKTINSIIKKIKTYKKNEITSKKIGGLVAKKLKSLDKVAYVRFASVYKSFDDTKDFEKELKELK